jgi:hypothetical protein
VKYWEIIANRLIKAGWSLGWVSVGFANGFGVPVFDTALLVSLPHLHVVDGISG